jgi:hypothetical protein
MNLVPYGDRTLGVRPERLSPQPSDQAIPLTIDVTAVEFIGHEWLIHGVHGSTPVIMRSHERGHHHAGVSTTWYVPEDAARWY